MHQCSNCSVQKIIYTLLINVFILKHSYVVVVSGHLAALPPLTGVHHPLTICPSRHSIFSFLISASATSCMSLRVKE